MRYSRRSENAPLVFWPYSAIRGINRAIAEDKYIVCFFTDGRKESRRWERVYLQQYGVRWRLQDRAITIRVETGSFDAKLMKRFIPAIKQIPVVFVMSMKEVRGCILPGVTKNQFMHRMIRKVDGLFERTSLRFVDPEPYVNEEKLEMSPARLMALYMLLMREGRRRYGHEDESFSMRRWEWKVKIWMTPWIVKFSRNTRRLFQAFFNDERMTRDIESRRSEQDYKQYLVTREASEYEFAKPRDTGEWAYVSTSRYPYHEFRPVKGMMSTETHPICTVNIRVRYFRLKEQFQGQLPISVLREWLKRKHPEKTPDEFYMRIIGKESNYDLYDERDEFVPFSKYGGRGAQPKCTIKIVPLSEEEREDEEEQVPKPWWWEGLSWQQFFFRILLFFIWTWPGDVRRFWRSLPDNKRWEEEERELRRQGRWHLGMEHDYGMGIGMYGRHHL